MKRTITITIGVLLMLFSVVYILVNNLDDISNTWYSQLSICTVFLVLYVWFVWKKNGFAFWSPIFFIIFSLFMFHLSTVAYCFVDDTVLEDDNLMLTRYGEEIGLMASLYSLLFIYVFVIGCVIYKKSEYQTKQKDEIISESVLSQCRKLGLILMSISILPEFYHQYMQIISRVTLGYAEVDATIGSNFMGIPIGFLFNLFIPSLLLILSSYRYQKKKFMVIAGLWFVYYVILMFFTGRKGSSIQAIIPVIFMYCYFYRPKVRLLYAFVLYIVLMVMTITTKTRFMVMGVGFSNSVKELIVENDPIREICVEMGGSIKGPIQAIMATRTITDFRMGLTYPLCFLDIINEYLHLGLDDIEQYVKFNKYLSDPSRGAVVNESVEFMGGSLIAEWYWNFWWLGLFFVPILAKFLCHYEQKIYVYTNKPVKFAIYVMFLHFILKWTRGYFYDVVWLTIYTYTAITILKKILLQKSIINKL